MRLITILFEKKEVPSVETDNAKILTISKHILHDEKDNVIEVMTMMTKFNYIRIWLPFQKRSVMVLKSSVEARR